VSRQNDPSTRKKEADETGVINEDHYRERVEAWSDPDARCNEFSSHAKRLLAWVGVGAKVLDLGAGEGFFSKACLNAGLEPLALEGSSVAVAWGLAHLGINARVHNLRDPLPEPSEAFDVVLYHDVYEHVPPSINETVFSEARRVLKPGGRFWVVTTCRYDFVECAELEHINNPTPTELLSFGLRRGFEGKVLRGGFNISLFTPRFYDALFHTTPRNARVRSILKRNRRLVTGLFGPVWLPIWYLNRMVLHLPQLDFVVCTSNVLFTKA
jgi:SAM-dependent methyltransferase